MRQPVLPVAEMIVETTVNVILAQLLMQPAGRRRGTAIGKRVELSNFQVPAPVSTAGISTRNPEFISSSLLFRSDLGIS